MRTLNPEIPRIANTPDVAMPLTSGPAAPLVLFPVRLETRFFPLESGAELRVRVKAAADGATDPELRERLSGLLPAAADCH